MSDLTDRLRAAVRWFDYKAHTDPCDESCGCVIREAADALDAAEAENARLREWLDTYVTDPAGVLAVIAGKKAAEAKLAAIDALHQPSPKNSDVQWCGHCNRWWPCPTHRILHPEDEQ